MCYHLIVPNDNGTQHSLVQRIAGQRTRLICGVRKLDDIDTPYITCEVRLSDDGAAVGVAQFYRAFNERPNAPEEREFLREFVEFIHNHE